LINELVSTGKFTEAEAKQFVSRIILDGANDSSISDDTESSNNQTNPEEYENLKELVDDIKNNVIDTEDISLNTFRDSAAYIRGRYTNSKLYRPSRENRRQSW